MPGSVSSRLWLGVVCGVLGLEEALQIWNIKEFGSWWRRGGLARIYQFGDGADLFWLVC